MPELPEVETVMRGLTPHLLGQKLTHITLHRPNLRFDFPDDFVQRLTGQTVVGLSRRAKYILIDLGNKDVWITHLGMTGRFCVTPPPRDAPADAPDTLAGFYYDQAHKPHHDHVQIILENQCEIIYNDPRRFGFMSVVARNDLAQHPFFHTLGVEPLGNAFDGATLMQQFAGRKTPIKAALLDQSVVAGLGNIYVCEALFASAIAPTRPACTLRSDEAERLAAHIRRILQQAIALGGSTLRDFSHTDGSSGQFQDEFHVYGRENAPCFVCARPIQRCVQAGRSTFYCAACQQ